MWSAHGAQGAPNQWRRKQVGADMTISAARSKMWVKMVRQRERLYRPGSAA
jgi:hypothetical protein